MVQKILTVLFVCMFSFGLHGVSYAQTEIVLYGNSFTIEMDKITELNNNPKMHAWRDVAYRVPQVLPEATKKDTQDLRSMDETLVTVSRLTLRYRDLFQRSIDKLARELVTQSHFNMIVLSEDKPFMRDQLYIMLVNEHEQEDLVRTADGYILTWLRNREWADHIEAYNKDQGYEAVTLESFDNAAKNYEQFLALFYLDTLVRMSPEYKAYAAAKRAGQNSAPSDP